MLLNHKLVLGTVQFGLPYGINNTKGQTEKEEVFKILQSAQKNAINTLDTAPAYGNSMETLGEFFKHSNSFSVISKFHGKTEKEIVGSVDKQLKVLNRTSLDVLLFHSYKDWLENQKRKDPNEFMMQYGAEFGASSSDPMFTPDSVNSMFNSMSMVPRREFGQSLTEYFCHLDPARTSDYYALVIAHTEVMYGTLGPDHTPLKRVVVDHVHFWRTCN